MNPFKQSNAGLDMLNQEHCKLPAQRYCMYKTKVYPWLHANSSIRRPMYKIDVREKDALRSS